MRDIVASIPQSVLKKAALISYLLLTVAGFIYCLHLPHNADTSWLMYIARKTYEGGALYIEYAETNPPLVVWLNMLAVSLSPSVTYDYPIYNGLAYLACIISLWMCYRLAKRAGYIKPNTSLLFVFALSSALLFLATNKEVFGQREHLFIVFCLPYVVYSIPSIFSRISLKSYQLVILGSWAAIGILLKPYFLILFIFIELYYLLLERRIHLSRLIIGMTIFLWGCLYVAISYMLYSVYFTEILPDLLRTYGEHSGGKSTIKRRLFHTTIPFLTLLPFFIYYYRASLNRDVVCAFTFLAATIAVCLTQFKGWIYSFYPIHAAIYFLIYCFYRRLTLDANTHDKKAAIIVGISIAISSILYQQYYAYNTLAITLLAIPLFAHLWAELFNARAQKSYVNALWLTYIALCSWFIIFLITDSLHDIRVYGPLVFAAVFLIAIIGWSFSFSLKDITSYRNSVLFYACFCMLITNPLYNFSRNHTRTALTERHIVMEITEAAKQYHPKSIYIFNANLYPAFPAFSMIGAEWGARYHHLWMFSRLYKYTNCKALPEYADIEERVLSNLESDLNRSRPDMLIFDTSTFKFISHRRRHGYYKCLARRPALKKLFRQYKKVKKLRFCEERRIRSCGYDIFLRKDLISQLNQ